MEHLYQKDCIDYDFLGLTLEDAVFCLNNLGKEYIIEYTHPVTHNQKMVLSDVAYVVRQKYEAGRVLLVAANKMRKEV